MAMATRLPKVMSCSSLMKDSVKNPKGEKLGKIEDIMIDVRHGRIAYAVLSFGGFLGMGDKLFAVPWDALAINPDDHSFVLDVDKRKLEEAPGFDKEHWPGTDDYTWSSQVYDYWGTSPYWNDTQQGTSTRNLV